MLNLPDRTTQLAVLDQPLEPVLHRLIKGRVQNALSLEGEAFLADLFFWMGAAALSRRSLQARSTLELLQDMPADQVLTPQGSVGSASKSGGD